MKPFLLILFSFLTIAVQAQGYVTVKNGSISSSSNYSTMSSFYSLRDGDVVVLNDETKGSPYLYEDFKKGVLVDDGKIVEKASMNYNVYYDIFMVKNIIPGEEPNKYIIKSGGVQLKVGNDLFVALPDPRNPSRLKYFQVLMTGEKFNLYKNHLKTYKPKIPATSSLVRDVPAIFKDSAILYLVASDGSMREIPNSKSKIVKLFPDHQSEIKNCIKKYKLNLKNEQDLLRLVRFYNTL